MSSTAPKIQCPNTWPSPDSSLSSGSGYVAPMGIEQNPHATQGPNSSGGFTKPEDKTQGSHSNIKGSGTAPVSERKVRFLEPDGRLEERFASMARHAVGDLRMNVVEDRIEFRRALFAGLIIETIISNEISGVWTTIAELPSLPKGRVRIPRATAADLTAKCDALLKQLYVSRPTYETANSFCAALQAVMQPFVEQYLSGSLQLTRRLRRKTVAVMPKDVRAALAKAFDRADARLKNNRLSEEAVKQVLEAIDVALGAIGRPAMPIPRSQPVKSVGSCIREYDGYFTFLPCEFRVLKRDLAAGTLELAFLGYHAGILRMRLMAQI